MCLLSLTTLIGTMPLLGCDGEVSFTTASLSEATMATGIDSESKPVGATDVFDADTPEIFCSVKLSNAPSDTEVLSEWVYIKGELEDVTDHVIDSFPVITDGTRYIEFSMTRPDNGWPTGEYEMVLYVDGKEKVTLPFTVGEASDSFATTGPSASLSEATMALGVDSDARPVNPTTTFAPDTPEIFCSVLLADAPEGTSILSEWYYVSGALEDVTNLLIDSVPLAADSTQYLQFSLTIPDNGWPAGEYKLVLYLDGAQEVSVPFTVTDTNPPTPSDNYLSEVTMARDVDSDARPVNPTSNFEVGTSRVYTSMLVADDVPPGAQLLVEWYEIQGTTTSLIDSTEMEIEGGYYYYVYYSWDAGWSKGEYAVVLYVNGEEQAFVQYTVS